MVIHLKISCSLQIEIKKINQIFCAQFNLSIYHIRQKQNAKNLTQLIFCISN